MMKTAPSSTPDFFRISDRDLTEVELHSVDSINDLHRTHPEQLHKGSRRPYPQVPSTNGNLHIHSIPVLCQPGHSTRRRWCGRIFSYCTPTVCRYTCGCVAVGLMLMALFVIFLFLVQQGGALRMLSQMAEDRQAASLEISQLIQELQELRRNLTAIKGSQGH
ncbi:hypothetical protein AAFF_G00041910 [Aldrovandia affinis]|uniref:Uncharacterized protein n=1 Tax=Aldrovandia affinis TaxID=143900 RepID=A0AAD7S4X2_9TELE|nr:hypothetical protein AAFF_G00041910 [Aldrovandia affinis]